MFWTPIQIVRGPTFIVFAFFSAVSLRFFSNSLDIRSTRSRELLLKHTWTPMCGCRSLVCKPKRKAFLCHKVRGLPTLIDSGLVHGTTQKIPGNRASRIIKSRPSMTCRLPYQQKSYEIMATLVKRRSFFESWSLRRSKLGTPQAAKFVSKHSSFAPWIRVRNVSGRDFTNGAAWSSGHFL